MTADKTRSPQHREPAADARGDGPVGPFRLGRYAWAAAAWTMAVGALMIYMPTWGRRAGARGGSLLAYLLLWTLGAVAIAAAWWNHRNHIRRQVDMAVEARQICDDPGPLRILLAEDNPVNQKITSILLTRCGHTVAIAENGEEALARIGEETFDVVLMDVQMPRLSGIEATRAIRESETGGEGRLPIIALTAHAMDGDRDKCLAAGMDEYLSKPVQIDALLEAIRRVVPDRSPERKARRLPAREESGADTEPGAFDKVELMGRLDGDVHSLVEVVDEFLRTCPGVLSAIGQAVDSRDSQALERAAHMLKGAVATLAAKPAFDAALNLEMMGRYGQLDAAGEGLTLLEERISSLTSALRTFIEDEVPCEY